MVAERTRIATTIAIARTGNDDPGKNSISSHIWFEKTKFLSFFSFKSSKIERWKCIQSHQHSSNHCCRYIHLLLKTFVCWISVDNGRFDEQTTRAIRFKFAKIDFVFLFVVCLKFVFRSERTWEARRTWWEDAIGWQQVSKLFLSFFFSFICQQFFFSKVFGQFSRSARRRWWTITPETTTATLINIDCSRRSHSSARVGVPLPIATQMPPTICRHNRLMRHRRRLRQRKMC